MQYCYDLIYVSCKKQRKITKSSRNAAPCSIINLRQYRILMHFKCKYPSAHRILMIADGTKGALTYLGSLFILDGGLFLVLIRASPPSRGEGLVICLPRMGL